MDGPLQRLAPEWVIFGCSGEEFAVPLSRVREILLPQPITRLPGCGPEICGLVGLRGRILTVVDFGAALGLTAAIATPDHRLLLVEYDGELVAGAVEEVHAVTHAEAPRILDLDEVLGRLLA
jgi:chemotaxis signal transduction protein